MRGFALNTVFFILSIICIDKIGGLGLKWLATHQKSGSYFELKQKLAMKPEIAILGSSRAEFHYNPELIKQITGVPVLNYGAAGQRLAGEYITLATLLQNNSNLKKVVLDIMPSELSVKPDFNEIKGFYPIMFYSNTIKELAIEKLPFERYKLLSSLYIYNNSIFELLTGYLRSSARLSKASGFRPIPNTDFKPIYGRLTEPPLNDECIRLLEKMLQLCKEKNVELLIVTSPYYGDVTESRTLPYIEAFCKEKNIYFVNYATDKRFTTKGNLFRDTDHLNGSGANLFSEIFSNDVKNILNLHKN